MNSDSENKIVDLEDVEKETEKNIKELKSPKLMKLRERFVLPNDEDLIAWFRCSLDKKIPYNGTMYITTNYLLFYSKLLKKENVQILLKDIEKIEKKKSAIIIPNALLIKTKKEEYYSFSAFLHRDKAYITIEAQRIEVEKIREQKKQEAEMQEKKKKINEVEHMIKKYKTLQKMQPVEIIEEKKSKCCNIL